MRTTSRTLAAALAAALLALAAAAATASAQGAADRGVPSGLTETRRSAHFLAHYTTRGPNRTTPGAVRSFLQAAEFGLARLTRLHGFRMPLPDDDKLVDIYVHNRLEAGNVAQASADDDRAGAPSSGYLEVDSDERDRGTLVHELAHVIQYGHGSGTEGDWLLEGTAAWASAAVYGARTTDAEYVTPISAQLTCEPVSECPGDGAYGVWRFWQSLSESFGQRFVGDVLRRAGALVRRSGGDPSLQALRSALAARGTTLPRAMQAYVERSARANWRHPKLRGIQSIVFRRAEPGEEQTHLLDRGAVRARVNLRPLSGRYVRITERGEPACSSSRLRVTARMPSRAGTVPSVLVSVGSGERLVRMRRAGGAFRATVAWRRCRSDAYLLVANGDAARPARVDVQAVVTR